MKTIHLVTEDSELESHVRVTLAYYDLKEKYTLEDIDSLNDGAMVRLQHLNEEFQHRGTPPAITINVSADFLLEEHGLDSLDLLIVDYLADESHTIKNRVRKDKSWLYLPMILLHDPSDEQDILRGYGFGYDMYLLRQFNPFALREFVRRVLESPSSPATI